MSADDGIVGIVTRLHRRDQNSEWFTWDLYFRASGDGGNTWAVPTRVSDFVANASAPYPHLLIANQQALVLYADGWARGDAFAPVVTSRADPTDSDYLRFAWSETAIEYHYAYALGARGEPVDLPFAIANHTNETREADVWISLLYRGSRLEIFEQSGIVLAPGESRKLGGYGRLVPLGMEPGTYLLKGVIGDHSADIEWDVDRLPVWVE